MANEKASNKIHEDFDIILEYRRIASPAKLENFRIRVEPDGSAIDLDTHICYSCLDDWFNACRPNKDIP